MQWNLISEHLGEKGKTQKHRKREITDLDSLGPSVVLHVAESSVGVICWYVGVEGDGFGVALDGTVELAGIEILVALVLQFLVTHPS